MKNISFFTKEFSVSKTTSYNLSLLAGHNEYAYSIADVVRNDYVAIKLSNYEEKIRNQPIFEKIKVMIQEDAFLNRNYKNINFAFLSRKSILIPTPLFSKKNLKSIFELNHPLADTEELHFNYINEIDAYNVFALPSGVTTFMVNRFPEIKFFHHSTSFINQAVHEERATRFKLPFIRINLNSDFFDILVIMADQPVLYNTFEFKTDEDILYHSLNVLKQLDIQPVKCHVKLSGDIDKKSNLFSQILNFIPTTEIIRPKLIFNYQFDEIPEHKLYNVLNLHKCE